MSHALLGCWQLHQCRLSFSDGRPCRYPFQRGIISYHPNGYMQASLSVHPRPESSEQDLERGHRLTAEEKALCFDQFLSYSGTFTHTETEVHHHVQLSLHPSVIGTTLTRQFRFEEDKLILSYTYAVHAHLTCMYELQWTQNKPS